MRVFIDAAMPAEQTLFGMSLLERHLRALLRTGARFDYVCIHAGEQGRPAIPGDLSSRLPLRFESGGGDLARRLAPHVEAGAAAVLVVAADTVVDPRLFEFALAAKSSFVARDGDAALVLLQLPLGGGLPHAAADVGSLGEAVMRSGAVDALRQDEFPGFIRGLRRTLPYFVLPVRDAAMRAHAEKFLFRANYKGSTDFFTRYVYPFLVWNLLRPLARLRVHPNWITGLNVVLGIAAIPAFAAGHYLAGFACAYGMSVLDSVDGKLARLTFTDSKLGTLLDHGLDLIHPPFWYLAWAWAVAGSNLHDPLMLAGCMLVLIYVLDRLCLKVYSVTFKRGLHAHAAIDGAVRTFIARRNINLPVFTAGIVLGLGREAFYLIVVWQLATLIWHVARVGWILTVERDGGTSGDGRLAPTG